MVSVHAFAPDDSVKLRTRCETHQTCDTFGWHRFMQLNQIGEKKITTVKTVVMVEVCWKLLFLFFKHMRHQMSATTHKKSEIQHVHEPTVGCLPQGQVICLMCENSDSLYVVDIPENEFYPIHT